MVLPLTSISIKMLRIKILIFTSFFRCRLEKKKGIEVLRCKLSNRLFHILILLQVASAINSDERGGRAKLVFLDDDPQNATFWGHFGGIQDPLSLPDGDNDDTVPPRRTNQLFRISDSTGSLQFEAVASGALSRDLLQSDDVFMVVGKIGKCLFVRIFHCDCCINMRVIALQKNSRPNCCLFISHLFVPLYFQLF